MPVLGFGVFRNYEARPACVEAFKVGYRHIDSAQTYRNEAAVGEAVRESGLNRSDVFITTKCVSGDHGYRETLWGVDVSLRLFGFEYLDLFLIHDPMSGRDKRLATYQALLECKTAGKIRTIGVSNYNIKHLEEIRLAGYEMPAVNQIELHPLCQQKPIVEYCQKHSIVVQAYCPIIRGQIDHEVFSSIAVKHNRDPAQILLRWSLQKGYVPLPKSATPARIRSNAQVFDFELDDDDMARLDTLDKGKAGGVSWNPIDVD
ncbi:NADP-dependent oxidoreductase domain-containing protein [Rhodocollybia butyracea]|uniref:NADP-dependent oxidoreductase domain-containing protein n=1 Tax=Rhodocollybia butyracea TaxID=206335 RepID=A0A9P5PX08_9AGAR|nr:NADP-dependent oxidoreductase domain-containing protein [Rhodocollybia butyracea]